MKGNLVSLAIITSLLSCGLLIPVWLVIGTIYALVELFAPGPQIVPVQKKPEYTTIYPTNDDASDWEYVIRDLPDEG